MLRKLPGRLGHRQPVAVGLEPPVEHEFRLVLLGGYDADDVFVQPGRDGFGVDV